MKRILCCSTQGNFQENLPPELPADFKQRWNVDEIIFRTFAVDEDFKSNIDWEEVKKEGVVGVVLCDAPHGNILHSFFQEAVYTADLPTFWYYRSGLIEIKPFEKMTIP